jgi:amino-acid N-acetyltransferase
MLSEIPATDRGLIDALTGEGLPVSDLGRRGQRFFAWADAHGCTVAHCGLEGQGDDRLLRSLVVAADRRGHGLAIRIVAALEHIAQADGAKRLWLLTETAGPVFDRLGYRRVERDAAPDTVAYTVQFSGLCPSKAVCMVRDIGG